jgi:hypothetical protein
VFDILLVALVPKTSPPLESNTEKEEIKAYRKQKDLTSKGFTTCSSKILLPLNECSPPLKEHSPPLS